ncbi:uncharacterized protein NPIL_49151 [Nephila pilipes]|uniref:Uncharacterized protein n=1 Tax=Nephila pilipes TaxID=299642 RepID=A0A8X6KAQ5_NEPPI|nr:uncharacterized protein NPIL_49151 [Nephila pilipes]
MLQALKHGKPVDTPRASFGNSTGRPKKWDNMALQQLCSCVCLLIFKLNRIAISSDIRQAFLQICLADKHKDTVQFLRTESNPRVEKRPTLQIYGSNRKIFGVNASQFLLAATVKHPIEKSRKSHPITVQYLDSFTYVDDWITGQDTREETLINTYHNLIMPRTS